MVLVLALVVGVVYVIMSIVVPELINTILSVIKAIPAALQRLDELIEPYGFSVSQVLNASFTVPSVSEVDAKIADMVNLLLKGAAFSTTVIGTVYQNVLSFFFTVMFTIYFFSSKERLRSQVKNLMRAYLKPAGSKRRFRWRTSASARFPASSRASAWRRASWAACSL